MRTAVLTSMALLLLCAFTVAAADISGKWVAQVPGPNHLLLEPTFTFKLDGAKLTGTMTYPLGDQVYRLEITEGKVGGDDVSFVVVGKAQSTLPDGVQESYWRRRHQHGRQLELSGVKS